jgi:catechol 2,3-dioxygenase-like lactoylglutathione lyase family enzyme
MSALVAPPPDGKDDVALATKPLEAVARAARALEGSDLEEKQTVTAPTLSVEVLTLPVSDVDRSLRFYVDQVGFTLDVDYAPNDAFRVVQLTPPGFSCSVQIGKGLTDAPAGSHRNAYRARRSGRRCQQRVRHAGVLYQRPVLLGSVRPREPYDGDRRRRAVE